MGKVSKDIFETQCNRKYKYAQVADLELCEREVVRMLKILRHVYYHSGGLLMEHLYAQPNKADQNFSAAKSFIS